MVSIRPRISKFVAPFFKTLGTVSSTSITSGSIITLIFRSLLSSRVRLEYLYLFSFSAIIIYSLIVFQISFTWWFFTGV